MPEKKSKAGEKPLKRAKRLTSFMVNNKIGVTTSFELEEHNDNPYLLCFDYFGSTLGSI